MSGKRANPAGATVVVLDAGALIAIERNDERMAALLAKSSAQATEFCIPAGAVAQAWRAGSRQARLARLLTDPAVNVVPLDDIRARAAGLLCGVTNTSDVIDASVVLCARERGRARIITGDPDDLARLDPHARIVAL